MSYQAASFPPPTIWRSQSALVMAKHAQLPPRCVKCNAPTRQTLKRNLRWHHPALYILIFVGVLLYVICSMVVSKSATIHVGLCDTHLAARKRDIIITCFVVFLSIGSFFVAGAMEDMTFVFVGSIGFLVGVIYGVVRTKVVAPQKIDDRYVWLTGVDASYLRQFPELRRAR